MPKHLSLVFIPFLFSTLAVGEDFTIQAFAGGGLPQNIQGTSAVLHGPAGIVTDANGNAFFTLMTQNIVLKLNTNGVLTLMAGNGTSGFSGDGGLATNAQFNTPEGIAVDGAGNLYIADYGNARIRKVQNGVISTVAGGGTQTADNVPAINTLLANPRYVAADGAGSVYVEDPGFYGCLSPCSRIRKITNGMITTIAGTGTFGFSGDGGPATGAQLAGLGAMAIDAAGTLYFSDAGMNFIQSPPLNYAHIRKIQNGVISTVANVGSFVLAVDRAGNLFVTYPNQDTVVQEISNGVMTPIAGTENSANGQTIGDNGPAADAVIGQVYGLSVDQAGNILIAAQLPAGSPVDGDLIRKVSNGVITTVAGGAAGAQALVGDNGPPADAQLFFALGGNNFGISANLAMDAAGNVYIAELNRVRKISQGVITTVAGTGVAGFAGDNGPATDAQLNSPGGIGLDAAGNLYIADQGNSRVRKVSKGVITTIAGNGSQGYSGDGGPATSAQLEVGGLAVSPAGDVYVSSPLGAQVVRKISNGTIVTVAGGGTNYGDGIPATDSGLLQPTGLALDGAGNLYIVEPIFGRIRKVSNGMISTVAGNFLMQSSGDGGPATSAGLFYPSVVAVNALGRVYIVEEEAVRRVSNGIISTVAGNRITGDGGDGGAALNASITPVGLAIGPNGQVYEADFLASRVRVLTPVPVPGVSFSASPASIPTNIGSTVGQTTLSWAAPGFNSLQIFANGSLFADVGTSGSIATGNWVSDGMNFSLVDPATSSPLSTITVHTTASGNGQIAFTADPNPIALAAGASVGKTTLSWNAPGNSGLQIWVDGVLFDAGLPASGSVETGDWVSGGTSFALANPSGQTIATLTVRAK